MKNFLFFLFFGIKMISFSQNERHITMIYQEPVCPPSWIIFANDKATLKNLKELLAKDSIEVFRLKFSGNPFAVTCEGCQCLTGRNIEVIIKEQDQEKLKELRFKLRKNLHLN